LVAHGEYFIFTIAELQFLRYLERPFGIVLHNFTVFIYSTDSRETYKGVLLNPN